jgi:hypothetical protein
MLATKKNWQKPKLIILERGRPEESILVTCKVAGIEGPKAGRAHCYGAKSCTKTQCSDLSAS